MIANTATVGFIMSHACPLKCNFCCHDRETMGPGRVTRKMIVDTIIAFAEQESVRDFAFSGGDPFLYYKDIVAAMREVRQSGVRQPFHIATSGYWAKDGATRPLLEELWSLGMHKIALSYDYEHSNWVSPDQIMEICRIAADIGMHVEVWGSFWDSSERVQDLLPEIERYAAVSNHIVYQAGRAARSGRRARQQNGESYVYSCGRAAHYSIAVFPDGEAFPCCSGDFNRSAKLSCGNVLSDTAEDILSAAYGNFHVRTAKEIGWNTLYAVVDTHFPELAPQLPRFADVDSPCEICRTLNVTLKDELAPVYAMMESAYATSRAELDWDRSSSVGEAHLDGAPVTRDNLHARFVADPALRRRYLADQVVIER